MAGAAIGCSGYGWLAACVCSTKCNSVQLSAPVKALVAGLGSLRGIWVHLLQELNHSVGCKQAGSRGTSRPGGGCTGEQAARH